VGVRSTADRSAVSLGLEGSSVEVNGEVVSVIFDGTTALMN